MKYFLNENQNKYFLDAKENDKGAETDLRQSNVFIKVAWSDENLKFVKSRFDSTYLT